MITTVIYYLFVFILFVVSLPLQCFIAIVLTMTSGFPIIFSQVRIGKGNKRFRIYKFRTMVMDAEKKKDSLQLLNEASGPVFKIRDDPRFTPPGRFLSHTGLDELPQLWNVLTGTMALFGPRPMPLSEAKNLTYWQQKRHSVKPGIMSPWILDGYHRTSFNAWMKSDITYAHNKSVGMDILLFGRTIIFLLQLFTGEMTSIFHAQEKCVPSA